MSIGSKKFLILVFIPLISASSVYYQFLKFASILKDKRAATSENSLESCYQKTCLNLCDRSCEREALGCASRSRNLQSKAIACFRASDRMFSNQGEVEECLYNCDIKVNGIDIEIRKPLLAIRGRDNLYTEDNSVERCWVDKCSGIFMQCDDDDACRGAIECSWQNGMTRFQRSLCVNSDKSPIISSLMECIRRCDLDSSLIFTDPRNADV